MAFYSEPANFKNHVGGAAVFNLSPSNSTLEKVGNFDVDLNVQLAHKGDWIKVLTAVVAALIVVAVVAVVIVKKRKKAK